MSLPLRSKPNGWPDTLRKPWLEWPATRLAVEFECMNIGTKIGEKRDHHEPGDGEPRADAQALRLRPPEPPAGFLRLRVLERELGLGDRAR